MSVAFRVLLQKQISPLITLIELISTDRNLSFRGAVATLHLTFEKMQRRGTCSAAAWREPRSSSAQEIRTSSLMP